MSTLTSSLETAEVNLGMELEEVIIRPHSSNQLPPPAPASTAAVGPIETGPETPTVEADILHSERLTEELIDAIEDVTKLRSLFANFYKKSSSAEKEHQKFKAEQLRKLQESESRNEVFKEELYKKIYEALEQDLNCSICSELFIQPAVLECGHTFCAHCIGQWKNGGNRGCPICRQYIFRPVTKHVGLGNFLTKFHTLLSQEIRERREQLIQERAQQVTAPPTPVIVPTASTDMRAAFYNPSGPRITYHRGIITTADMLNNNNNIIDSSTQPGHSDGASTGTNVGNLQSAVGVVGNLNTMAAAANVNPQVGVVPRSGPMPPSSIMQARHRNAAVLDRLRARMQAYRNTADLPLPPSNSSNSSTAAVSPVSGASSATTATNPGSTAGNNAAAAAAASVESSSVAQTALTSSPFYQSLVAEIETLRQNLANRRAEADLSRFQIITNPADIDSVLRASPYSMVMESPRSSSNRVSRPPNRYAGINERGNLEFEVNGGSRNLHRISRASHAIRPPSSRHLRPPRGGIEALIPPPPRYSSSSDNNRNLPTRDNSIDSSARIEYAAADSANNRDQNISSGSNSNNNNNNNRSRQLRGPQEDWLNYESVIDLEDFDFEDQVAMDEVDDMILL